MPEIAGSVRSPLVSQFLSASVEEAPEGILAFDTECRYILWNRRMQEISGKHRDDVLGRTAFDVFPFLLETGEDAFFKATLRGESTEVRARQYEIPGGKSGYFDAMYRPVRDDRGEVIGGIAHIRECERAEKEAQLEVHKMEERLKLVATTTGVGTWYCDLPFDVLEWSAKTKEHFWLPENARVTIDTFYERIHPEDRERTRRAIADSIEKKTLYDVDYRTVSDDGRIRWIRAIGRGFYDEQGHPMRFDGVTVDQTDRRSAEEALRRSERLATAGRLAATVAHEVNNPLEAVTNLIYLAQHDPDSTDNVRSKLKLADEELRRVAHIVRQTLGFYRESTVPMSTNVSEAVAGLVDLYQKRYSQKRVELETNLDPSVNATVVPGGVRQVIANLLSNALDACSAGDKVMVTVRARAGLAELVVEDSGHGIRIEDGPRLFEPFFTTKTDIGTGLGLWVSKGIVEKHGGKISVQSSTDAQNHGTVFTVTLPAAQK